MTIRKFPEIVGPVKLRPKQWMQLTGMGRTETYQNIYAGRLRAVQIGKSWYIDASELTEFFERHNVAA